MSSFDLKESADWSLAVNTETDKLLEGVDKALTDSAARGWPTPPGETLGLILDAGVEMQKKLTAANGQIYDQGREKLFKIDEFALKVLVRIAKLSLEAYREQIMNALALEQSQQVAGTERRRADVERLNTETEARMIGVIRAKAEMEQSIIIFRQQLITAERNSLTAEALLINAQLETAEKKLQIIDSIYQVIAAEKLVMVAEQRRAATLEVVLEAEKRVAAVKMEMVPFYQQKAKAREALAVSILKENEIREALERLGYDRLDLKLVQEYFEHLGREADEDYTTAEASLARARGATEVARTHLRRLILEYSNLIREEILALKEQLEKDGIDFKLSIALAKLGLNLDDEVTLTDHNRKIINEELANLLSNMVSRALDQDATIRDSASTTTVADTYQLFSRKILEGFAAGRSGGGSFGFETPLE